MNKTFNNYSTLVFSGGSVKCISFCGALRYLKEYNMVDNINHIIGVSGGSLIGLFYILGYSPDDIINEITKLNAEYIFGQELSIWSLPGNIYSLINNFGISDGKQLKEQLRALLSRKNIPFSITFEQLYDIIPIKFTITATNLHSRKIDAFNHILTPNIQIIKALQASMCLPFIFQPVTINHELYIDGGMIDNLPVALTDDSEKVLAIKLETEENINKIQNYSFIQFVSDILDTLFINVWPDITKYEYRIDFITILVPYISMLNFNLNSEEIQTLTNAGYDSMCNKFQYCFKHQNINDECNQIKHHRKYKGSKGRH